MSINPVFCLRSNAVNRRPEHSALDISGFLTQISAEVLIPLVFEFREDRWSVVSLLQLPHCFNSPTQNRITICHLTGRKGAIVGDRNVFHQVETAEMETVLRNGCVPGEQVTFPSLERQRNLRRT